MTFYLKKKKKTNKTMVKSLLSFKWHAREFLLRQASLELPELNLVRDEIRCSAREA